MPLVAVAYHPADGTALDVGALNLDLYSTPAGDSILETSNGGLTHANLDTGFEFRRQHFRKGEVIDASSASLMTPMDYYDDLWVGFEGGDSFVHGIPGASYTWQQRFHAGVAQVNFGCFTSVWRIEERSADTAAPVIKTQLYVDGVGVTHTIRDMPVTVSWSNSGINDINFYIGEAYNTRCRNQSHLLTGLTKGFHTVELRVFVERQNGTALGDRNYPAARIVGRNDWGIKVLKYNLQHRLRVGVRNMTVLRVL